MDMEDPVHPKTSNIRDSKVQTRSRRGDDRSEWGSGKGWTGKKKQKIKGVGPWGLPPSQWQRGTVVSRHCSPAACLDLRGGDDDVEAHRRPGRGEVGGAPRVRPGRTASGRTARRETRSPPT